MPIYEYQCEQCGHRLEAIQRMSEDPLTDCPTCGQPALKKLISAAAFHLKGNGWYATDFKDQAKGKAAADSAPEAGGKEGTGGKEGAPAAAPESCPAPAPAAAACCGGGCGSGH
jgi:putative FmdB family regulatory protein